MSILGDVYGDLLIVRPPVPATCNKAGANYKSEVAHLEYSPRRAYDEWLSILDAIVACGGDAIYELEAVDEPFLDHPALEVDGDGTSTISSPPAALNWARARIPISSTVSRQSATNAGHSTASRLVPLRASSSIT